MIEKEYIVREFDPYLTSIKYVVTEYNTQVIPEEPRFPPFPPPTPTPDSGDSGSVIYGSEKSGASGDEKAVYSEEQSEYICSGEDAVELKLTYTGGGEKVTEAEAAKAVVSVDGETAESHCSITVLENGDISVEFSEEYLKTLEKGVHTITVEINGVVYTFTITVC